MNYEEIQQMEFDALKSIFMEEFIGFKLDFLIYFFILLVL
jgi:hypothetical protein